MRSRLRNDLSELRVLIIDEISMVSNLLLLHIHQRLVEIFGCNDDTPVYSEYNDLWQNLIHPWKLFKIAELTEVMRQKGDLFFIELLNKVRTADMEGKYEAILRSTIRHIN